MFFVFLFILMQHIFEVKVMGILPGVEGSGATAAVFHELTGNGWMDKHWMS